MWVSCNLSIFYWFWASMYICWQFLKKCWCSFWQNNRKKPNNMGNNKWASEETTSLEKPRERSSKPMGIIWDKASKNGLKRPKAMNQVSKGLMGFPSTLKVKDVIIGSGKPKRLNKSPWECIIRMCWGCPRRKKWAKEAHEQWNGLRRLEVAWMQAQW